MCIVGVLENTGFSGIFNIFHYVLEKAFVYYTDKRGYVDSKNEDILQDAGKNKG